MPQPEAAGSETPLVTEGPSASRGPREPDREAMAARVAAAKAAYDPTGAMPPPSDILDAIDRVDNGHPVSRPKGRVVTDAAPVRRHGAPPPARPDRVAAVVEAKPKKRKVRAKVIDQIEDITDEQLLADAGIVQFYSTTEAAQFFDRTNQWLYWGLGRDTDGAPVFIYPDSSPIEPERIGNPVTGRRRFTLPVIKDILLSSYRRGNIEPDELKKILRRIRINEMGGEWREREGWHKIRGKWVHPDHCEQVAGEWVRKKGSPDESRDVHSDTDRPSHATDES